MGKLAPHMRSKQKATQRGINLYNSILGETNFLLHKSLSDMGFPGYQNEYGKPHTFPVRIINSALYIEINPEHRIKIDTGAEKSAGDLSDLRNALTPELKDGQQQSIDIPNDVTKEAVLARDLLSLQDFFLELTGDSGWIFFNPREISYGVGMPDESQSIMSTGDSDSWYIIDTGRWDSELLRPAPPQDERILKRFGPWTGKFELKTAKPKSRARKKRLEIEMEPARTYDSMVVNKTTGVIGLKSMRYSLLYHVAFSRSPTHNHRCTFTSNTLCIKALRTHFERLMRIEKRLYWKGIGLRAQQDAEYKKLNLLVKKDYPNWPLRWLKGLPTISVGTGPVLIDTFSPFSFGDLPRDWNRCPGDARLITKLRELVPAIVGVLGWDWIKQFPFEMDIPHPHSRESQPGRFSFIGGMRKCGEYGGYMPAMRLTDIEHRLPWSFWKEQGFWGQKGQRHGHNCWAFVCTSSTHLGPGKYYSKDNLLRYKVDEIAEYVPSLGRHVRINIRPKLLKGGTSNQFPRFGRYNPIEDFDIENFRDIRTGIWGALSQGEANDFNKAYHNLYREWAFDYSWDNEDAVSALPQHGIGLGLLQGCKLHTVRRNPDGSNAYHTWFKNLGLQATPL
jgi:hypothetical protein